MRRRSYGWRKQQPDHRDFRFHAPSHVAAALPSKIDLRSPKTNLSPIEPNFDQGNLGSCGPNSAALHLAMDMALAGQSPLMPSRMFIYYYTRQLMGTIKEDSGVDNRTMLKALNKYGWCDESLWSYAISKYKTKPSKAAIAQAATRKIEEYQAVEQNLVAMQSCLASGSPFIFGFTVYESFESAAVDRTGDVPMPKKSESIFGGHDVLIVGYDDATGRFTFKNSYGESWGNKGDGTIPYAYAADPDLAGDFWTIPSGIQTPVEPIQPMEDEFEIRLRINPTTKTAVQVLV